MDVIALAEISRMEIASMLFNILCGLIEAATLDYHNLVVDGEWMDGR